MTYVSQHDVKIYTNQSRCNHSLKLPCLSNLNLTAIEKVHWILLCWACCVNVEGSFFKNVRQFYFKINRHFFFPSPLWLAISYLFIFQHLRKLLNKSIIRWVRRLSIRFRIRFSQFVKLKRKRIFIKLISLQFLQYYADNSFLFPPSKIFTISWFNKMGRSWYFRITCRELASEKIFK